LNPEFAVQKVLCVVVVGACWGCAIAGFAMGTTTHTTTAPSPQPVLFELHKMNQSQNGE